MIKHWWKILAVVILVYVIIVGMTKPLSSGILEVSPAAVAAGQRMTFNINTYNTVFEKGGTVKAFIKIDSLHLIPAQNVTVLSDNAIKAAFNIPEYLPNDKKSWSYPLILSDAQNGSFVRPSVISISQKEVNPSLGKQNWSYSSDIKLFQNDEMRFPFRALIYETIRNTYFHVPLWFGMVFIFLASAIYSVLFLQSANPLHDLNALSFTRVGVLYGILGCITGAIWAKYTWGTWWTFSEIKLNVSAIAMLIYLAYFVLRSSFEDEERQARVSAVYNIFAFVAMVPLLFVIPRMVDGSLHPGNGGNPGFGGDDLDNYMRMVFYPAIIGWTLLGFWIATLVYRMEKLRYQSLDEDY